ncbi:MAG: M3 family oligoendopeptidase, partial [Alphaproteobacteria bacterium]
MARAAKTKKGASLPEWDLSDFYNAPDSPSLLKDLQKLRKLCKQFATDYQGKVAGLAAPRLAQAIAEYEKISEMMGKIGSYAGLRFAKNMTDPANAQFYQNMSESLTDLSSQILFFTLNVNKISDKDLKTRLSNPALKKYAPWLRDVRSYRPYQLADELEKLLHEKQVCGQAAWIRLFDETIAALRFPVDGKELTEPEAFNLLSSSDAEARKKAAVAVGKVFGGKVGLFSLITNTLAKDKEIEDKWRGFARPISSRNVSNYIEDEVVDALVTTVRKNYPDLSHRYYKLKAKWLGKKRLDYWDRNAPLPGVPERIFGWDEARSIVLDSYHNFSPKLAAVGRTFFDKPWIDAAVTPGKSPGAFAHPTVPSVHPYLLLNFQGKTRDVMTLAHELGHGVHQVLAARQGQLMCDTPLTLAETASVFGEQLTFQELVRMEKDEKRRRHIIASKVEDMLNTVVRQVAFCEFERRVHDERRSGELSSDRICDIWM